MAKLTKAQTRMLQTLDHGGEMGVPIGLSDLSNPAFNSLMARGLVSSAWVDVGSIKARITKSGRAALQDGQT